MNLLPLIHIHKGSCATTFKFLLGTTPLLLNDALSVFEYVNSSKTNELWAFRMSGKAITVYSPPLTYALEEADEYSILYRICDPARVLNWLPPYVVSSFVVLSQKIPVVIENDPENIQHTTLSDLLIHSAGYNLRQIPSK